MRGLIRTGIVALGSAVVMVSVASAQAHPSFDGTWTMDATKSTSDGALPTAATWVVAQHGDTVIIDRETAAEGMGTIKSHVVFGVDGKAWKNTVTQPGIGDIETSTVTSWSGTTLVIAATGNIQGTDFVQTDHWTLSADGKTLTSNRSVSVQDQVVQSGTLVFTKKP